MRKFLLVVLMVALCSPVYAFDVNLGVESEFVLDRRVTIEDVGQKAEFDAQYYGVQLELEPFHWLRVSPTVSVMQFQAEMSPMGTAVDVDSGFGWAVGVDVEADVYRARAGDLYICDVTLMGGYRFSRADIDEVDIGLMSIDNPVESIVYLYEWELGAKVSRNMRDLISVPIIPYIGVVYSDIDGEVEVNTSAIIGADLESDIEGRDNIGLRVGVVTEEIKGISFGLEAKLVDQTAITGRIAYRF